MIESRRPILDALFSSERIAAILGDRATVRAMLEVEGALARVQARLGVIPATAGEEITSIVAGAELDMPAIVDGARRSGVPVISIVEQLRERLAPASADYLHFGATSQDIWDTACVLQLRSAIALLDEQLTDLVGLLGALAERHRATLMAARTHAQQALPTTFGLKVVNWLMPLRRSQDRLAELKDRVLVVQLGGGAGTLAALGDRGVEVMEGLAVELDLSSPVVPWHTQRDSIAELASWLSLVTGSLAKLAQDVILLAQTEIGELAESGDSERGGSSTMPQKRNPIVSELVVAAARTNAALLSAMHQAMIQEQERGTHGWQMEWWNLPQMLTLASGALEHTSFVVEHLEVDGARMSLNVELANHQILAEAVAFRLAGQMPRSQAHRLVREASAEAASQGRSWIDLIRERVPDVELGELLDPARYLGVCDVWIDRALATLGDRDG